MAAFMAHDQDDSVSDIAHAHIEMRADVLKKFSPDLLRKNTA